jgi:hypothetical protein
MDPISVYSIGLSVSFLSVLSHVAMQRLLKERINRIVNNSSLKYSQKLEMIVGMVFDLSSSQKKEIMPGLLETFPELKAKLESKTTRIGTRTRGL